MKHEEKSQRLLTYLRSVKNDTGTMAELRCLLNPNMRSRGWRAIAKAGGIGDVVMETISGLYAKHPVESNRSFGRVCRELSLARKITAPKKEEDDGASPFDRRFRRLLASGREEACVQLYGIISGLRAENMGVNYEELCTDLFYWGDRVKERWAQDYWGNGKEEADDVSE